MGSRWAVELSCWTPQVSKTGALGWQAAVSVAALGGSGAFPPAAALVAVTLLCHHTLIHWRSRFEGEACSCAPFQCKDVSNHETWVVAALVAAAVSWWGV